jgi:hypothetical protein
MQLVTLADALSSEDEDCSGNAQDIVTELENTCDDVLKEYGNWYVWGVDIRSAQERGLSLKKAKYVNALSNMDGRVYFVRARVIVHEGEVIVTTDKALDAFA